MVCDVKVHASSAESSRIMWAAPLALLALDISMLRQPRQEHRILRGLKQFYASSMLADEVRMRTPNLQGIHSLPERR